MRTYQFRVLFEPDHRHQSGGRYYAEYRRVLFSLIPLWWERERRTYMNPRSRPDIGGSIVPYNTQPEALEALEVLKRELGDKATPHTVTHQEQVQCGR